MILLLKKKAGCLLTLSGLMLCGAIIKGEESLNQSSSSSWEYSEGEKCGRWFIDYISKEIIEDRNDKNAPQDRWASNQQCEEFARYFKQFPTNKERLLHVEGLNDYLAKFDYEKFARELQVNQAEYLRVLLLYFIAVDMPIDAKLLYGEMVTDPKKFGRRYSYRHHPRYEEFVNAFSVVFEKALEKATLSAFGPESKEYKNIVEKGFFQGLGEICYHGVLHK